MRFIEMLREQDTPTADVNKRPRAKGMGPFEINGVKYANKLEQQQPIERIKSILVKEFPSVNVRNDVEDLNANKLIPSIRILNALPKDRVVELLAKNGLPLTKTTNPTQMVSGTYKDSIYTATGRDGTVFTVVIAGKGGPVGAEGKCQVGIQMLRPEKFGLKGIDLTKQQMIALVKKNLPAVIPSDIKLQQALSQLVDVAAGQRQSIDAELMDHITPCLNLISQDFGEILTPIVLAQNANDVISFSAVSNTPLIDVTVKGTPVAVKSLGGSGNSFAAIRDLIDDYEKSMLASDSAWNADKYFAILKDFISKEGKTNDKLIRAAQKAQVPEATKLNQILGTAPTNYAEMESAVSNLIDKLSQTPQGQKDLYTAYIDTIMPAALAAGRTRGKNVKPVGIPRSRAKFDANFKRAASRQLTYMLGMAFRNAVVEGEDAKDMAQTITNVMTKKNAKAAWITINKNGSIQVSETPFKDLKFGFQYHAGTDTPDQNAPGFHIQFS